MPLVAMDGCDRSVWRWKVLYGVLNVTDVETQESEKELMSLSRKSTSTRAGLLLHEEFRPKGSCLVEY